MVLVTKAEARQGTRHAPVAAVHCGGRGNRARRWASTPPSSGGRSICRWASATSIRCPAGASLPVCAWPSMRLPASPSDAAGAEDLARIVALTACAAVLSGPPCCAICSCGPLASPALPMVETAISRGYALGRDGHRAGHIGPVVADHEACGLALATRALASTHQPCDPGCSRPARHVATVARSAGGLGTPWLHAHAAGDRPEPSRTAAASSPWRAGVGVKAA